MFDWFKRKSIKAEKQLRQQIELESNRMTDALVDLKEEVSAVKSERKEMHDMLDAALLKIGARHK